MAVSLGAQSILCNLQDFFRNGNFLKFSSLRKIDRGEILEKNPSQKSDAPFLVSVEFANSRPGNMSHADREHRRMELGALLRKKREKNRERRRGDEIRGW